MSRGVLEEPAPLRTYARPFNREVTTAGLLVRDDWGFSIGYSPDGLVGDDGLVEVKSPRQRAPGCKPSSMTMAPTYHMAQLQTGLLVSGRQWIDVRLRRHAHLEVASRTRRGIMDRNPSPPLPTGEDNAAKSSRPLPQPLACPCLSCSTKWLVIEMDLTGDNNRTQQRPPDAVGALSGPRQLHHHEGRQGNAEQPVNLHCQMSGSTSVATGKSMRRPGLNLGPDAAMRTSVVG